MRVLVFLFAAFGLLSAGYIASTIVHDRLNASVTVEQQVPAEQSTIVEQPVTVVASYCHDQASGYGCVDETKAESCVGSVRFDDIESCTLAAPVDPEAWCCMSDGRCAVNDGVTTRCYSRDIADQSTPSGAFIAGKTWDACNVLCKAIRVK